MSRITRISVVLLTLFPILSSICYAQYGARLQGVITDPSGAVLPNATVTLTSNETKRSLTTTTNNDGFYSFPQLAPGSYALSASATNFAQKTLTDIRVAAEQTQGQNLTLETAGTVQQVTVTDTTSASLNTENANISRELSHEEVTRLPQFARNPYDLLRLAPNVTGDAARSGSGQAVALPNTTGPGGSNSSIFQTENQTPISANGQRVSDNNYQIDGVSVNSLTWGGAAVVTPNQESVKQIVIVTDPYSAQYGRNSGAQINVISENGTNQPHGSGFFRYSSPSLNSYNKWGGPGGAPPTRVNQLYRQFGGSLGGPIIKNKLFWFFSYEGLRSNTTGYYNAYVETPEFRQAVISSRPNSLAAQVLQSPGIQPRIVSVLNSPCPAAFAAGACQVVNGGLNIGSLSGALGQYTSATGGGLSTLPEIQYAQLANPQTQQGNQYNGRIDYNLGSKDTLAFSLYMTKFDNTGADTASASRPQADLTLSPLNAAGTFLENHIFSPTILNEFRANFTRFAYNQVSSSSNVNFGIPRLEIEGLPIARIAFGAPRSETTPGILAQNTYEIRDYLNHVVGNNSFKYGLELRLDQDNNNLLGGARPIYTFTGLFNFANDAPVFESINADPITGLPANAQRYLRQRTYALFIQDDWKIRSNLTVNLGLRWEYFTPIRETRGNLTNIMFGSNGLQNATIQKVDDLYRPNRTNFAPRVGFAYQPFGSTSKMVVRGGFGMYYDKLPLALFANAAANPPNFARYNICCGTTGSPFANGQIQYAFGASQSPTSYPVNQRLATGVNSATGFPNGGAVEIWGAQQYMPTPYVYIYSFQVEYQLPANFVASLGYSGSNTRHQVRIVNQNFLYPNNPSAFAVYIPQPDVNAHYNALLGVLTRQLTRGWQTQVSYRFSKSMDQLSYGGPGATTNQTYPQNNRLEWGPSDFDATHTFKLSSLFDLPLYRGNSNFMRALLGGWEINPIATYHSGFPWTPKIGQSVSTPGGPTLAPIRPVAYFGGALNSQSDEAWQTGSNFAGGGAKYFDIKSSGPPGIGRNSFRGPHFFQIDASLGKRTKLPWLHLGEATELELRGDFYNVFNQLNLSPLGFFSAGTMADNPFFGYADNALAGRVIQLQARFSF